MALVFNLTWRAFWRWFLALGLGIPALLYLGVLLVDPYDVIVFSPEIGRGVTASNQRFAWPAMAREPGYDSAIIGTSTTRLLKPEELNRTTGGRFVNLSFNSGTAWEQAQILKLFARTHPRARTVIFGIDNIWCRVEKTTAKLTFRAFPEWMYDDNPWNDLAHHLNLKAVEEAGKQIGHLTGLKPSERGPGGYHDFLPPRPEYDLARARKHIYGAGGPRAPRPQVPPYAPTSAERSGWTYASHAYMAEMLAALPPETLKILLVVPYHRNVQPAPGTKAAAQLAECKRRLVALAAAQGAPGTIHVLDFMIDSRITRVDENYWDPLHYAHEVATLLGQLIPEGVRKRAGQADTFRYLGPPG